MRRGGLDRRGGRAFGQFKARPRRRRQSQLRMADHRQLATAGSRKPSLQKPPCKSRPADHNFRKPDRERQMEARTSRYREVYARWRRDPEGFWAEAAQDIDWVEPARQVFDPSAGVYGRWFAGAVCNTCWNAVDRHVHNGRGSQLAIIYDSPLAC